MPNLTFSIENEHPNPTRVALDDIYSPLGVPKPNPCFARLERFVFEGEDRPEDRGTWVYLCEYMIHLNGGGATGLEGQVDGEESRVRLLMPGERLVISLAPATNLK